MDEIILTVEQYTEVQNFLPEKYFFAPPLMENGREVSYSLPKKVYEKALNKLKRYIEEQEKLNACANKNKAGAEAEKKGNIEKAIRIYEDNIAGKCYPARHSFDRLLVIYKQQKDYKKELRVAKKAYSIFKDEKYKTRQAKIEKSLLKE